MNPAFRPFASGQTVPSSVEDTLPRRTASRGATPPRIFPLLPPSLKLRRATVALRGGGRVLRGSIPPHLAPALLFAILAIVWTWPLILHLSSAVPGDPGDNYSFLWNLWWMRHTRSTPGLEFFRTTFLFHPSGASIANHPHTALPALIGATVLRSQSIAAAQNLILLAHVLANMASMYWLAWTMTRHRRAATLAAVIFGLSPYFSVHLLGHFDLMAGWLLPAFACLFHLAIRRRSTTAGIGAGIVLAAGAYTVYYYVVYLLLFAVTYTLAVPSWIHVSWSRRAKTNRILLIRAALVATAAAASTLALWIILGGGFTADVGGQQLSLHQPQNPLSLMWLSLIGAAVCTWKPRVAMNRQASPLDAALRAFAWILAVFAVACAPLIAEAARLVRHREYVTPTYLWRSAPRGIDLLGPLLGHPRHPFMRGPSQRAYRAMRVNYIETVAWIGVVPPLLVFWPRRPSAAPDTRDVRAWNIVAAIFTLWAAGPFLTVAGFDVGLWLPEVLARYIPFVANAREPGRAMIGVYMALAMLIAIRIAGSKGRLQSAALQCMLVAAVIVEFFDAPIPLTILDNPPSYRALAAAPPGAVCEVPFGVGDGLGPGAGSQDRRVLFYATIHSHPLAGGYLGRMPAGTADRYAALPLTSTLLRLSRRDDERREEPRTEIRNGVAPCRYLVVNRLTAPASLQAYVASLPVERLASDDSRDVYRLIE